MLCDFRGQGISRHGIDTQSRDIPSPASEELIFHHMIYTRGQTPWGLWCLGHAEQQYQSCYTRIWHANAIGLTDFLSGESAGRQWFPSQRVSYVEFWWVLCCWTNSRVVVELRYHTVHVTSLSLLIFMSQSVSNIQKKIVTCHDKRNS